MRVRAAAASSLHCRSCEELLETAKEQVETLKQLAETDPEELTNRQRAARAPGGGGASGSDREAVRQCEELRTKKEAREKGRKEKSSEARAVDHGPWGPQHEVQRRRPAARIQRYGLRQTDDGRGGAAADARQRQPTTAVPPMLDRWRRVDLYAGQM